MAGIFADDMFLCIFLYQIFNFKRNFIEICSLGSNWQYTIIGSGNGLSPNRQQAIIWTNGGQFTDVYMRHSASMS